MNDDSPRRRPLVWLSGVLLALSLAACGGADPAALVASAKVNLSKDDPRAAIIQLKNALQENVTLAEARYLLGTALLRTGDAAGAEAELRKARDYQYPDVDVLPALAEAMLALKQFRKLTDEFAGRKLESPSAQARLHTTVAAAFIAQRKPDAARQAVEQALEADPNYARARIMQVKDLAARRDFDSAERTADALLAAAPAEPEVWQLKGDLLWFGRQRLDDALASYRKAVQLKPDFVQAHASILDRQIAGGKLEDAGKQLEQMKRAAPDGSSTLYYASLLAYLQKDLKGALTVSQQLVQRAPDNFRAQHLAGEIALANNAPAQAVGPLSEAVRLAPQHLRARAMLVRAYLATGRTAKALALLQPMLAGDKADVGTLLLAGEAYLQQGDPKKAQASFAKATQLYPKDNRARTALAVSQFSGEGSDLGALVDLQQISKVDRGVAAEMALISAYLTRRDFDAALKAIDGLEKKQPGKPQAATLRGSTLVAKKDFAAARQSYERSLTIDSGYFPAVAGLAALDLLDNRPQEASRRFEGLLARNPADTQALLALADMRAKTGGSKQEIVDLLSRAVAANAADWQPRVALMEFHMGNQDFKLAIAAGLNAIAALPDRPELLDALGRAQQAANDSNQALTTFGKLATLLPESAVPLMRMADVHLVAGNRDAAASSLRKAMGLEPDNLEVQGALVDLALQARNFGEARTIAQNLRKRYPKASTGFLWEGDTEAAQKNWDAALVIYRQGLAASPSTVLATRMHGTMRVAGRAAEAATFATTWLRGKPKDVEFRLYLGNDAGSQGDFAAAEKWYASVVELQPNHAGAINNQAWAMGQQGKDGALALAERAVALAPNEAAFMDTLAMVLLKRKEIAKAIELQNRVVAMRPQIPLYRLNLAKIQIEGGNKDLARKELATLSALGERFHGYAEVAKLLKSL